LRKVVSPEWFGPLDALVTDILDVDFERVIGDARRVLFLWDAHGFQIAEVVLGRILPALVGREHLVIMHDITDTRYSWVTPSYEGKPIWKGSTFPGAAQAARVNIGWMNSQQDQIVAIADFSKRNDLEIGSADHEYAQFFGSHPEAAEEMRQEVGEALFSVSAHWAFFTLAGKSMLQFPTVPPKPRPAALGRVPPEKIEAVVPEVATPEPPPTFFHETAVQIQVIYPPPRRWFNWPPRLPQTITTSAVAWRYAKVLTLRPLESLPADAKKTLRVRVRVESASAGISVLTVDQSAFIRTKRVAPSVHTQTIYLELDTQGEIGPLVVHTWEAPSSARVRLEEIAFVW
jgi:hypothetical protein